MVFITNEEYKELLEIKFKYELEHKENCNVKKRSEWVDVTSTNELKIGDKLRIKDKLNEIENFECGYLSEMDNLIGEIVTVDRITDNYIRIKEDEHHYNWDIRAFEREEK